jgi:hypothetical protein
MEVTRFETGKTYAAQKYHTGNLLYTEKVKVIRKNPVTQWITFMDSHGNKKVKKYCLVNGGSQSPSYEYVPFVNFDEFEPYFVNALNEVLE